MRKLFVYGTFKRAGLRGPYLRELGGVYLHDATMRNVTLFSVASAPFPALVSWDGGCVRGEVWDVPENALRTIDEIEGVAHGLYLRHYAQTDDGADVLTYIWGHREDWPLGQAIGPQWPPKGRINQNAR